jgi:hypothetical protein
MDKFIDAVRKHFLPGTDWSNGEDLEVTALIHRNAGFIATPVGQEL